MKIYGIGKYENRAVMNGVLRQLEGLGHEITHDWTNEDSTGVTGRARVDYLRRCAEEDLDGVRRAECVLVLHHNQLCGGLVELGVALADPNKLIVVVNLLDPVARRQPIFYWLPNVHHFETLQGAVQFITQSQKGLWE